MCHIFLYLPDDFRDYNSTIIAKNKLYRASKWSRNFSRVCYAIYKEVLFISMARVTGNYAIGENFLHFSVSSDYNFISSLH